MGRSLGRKRPDYSPVITDHAKEAFHTPESLYALASVAVVAADSATVWRYYESILTKVTFI